MKGDRLMRISIWRKSVLLARMVKIEHSIFALPFAYLGMIWAAGGWPGWKVFLALTLAMVAVRSFAMAVNRLVDLSHRFQKSAHPQQRPLVTGEIGVSETWVFIAACALIFVGACALLNPLCLALSPVALVWSGVYSYTKRFTRLCHFFLGSVLGACAALAGWLAVSPAIEMAPVLLGLGVTFWVGGFDILYACQDVEFDRAEGLHSLPAGKLGWRRRWLFRPRAMRSRAYFFCWPVGRRERGFHLRGRLSGRGGDPARGAPADLGSRI
jgi:4-hydroxybenzoate polyprenyltransferase